MGITKYRMVMQILQREIEQGVWRPGQKLPPEHTLAKQYEMSRHTVRKALSLLERAGYIEIRQGKGAFCREYQKQKKQTKIIGIILTYVSDYIFPALIRGIETVCAERGYGLLLQATGNDPKKEEKALQEMLEKGVDGLLIEPSKSALFCNHLAWYERLEQASIPYVFLQGQYDACLGKSHILLDDCQGGYLLTSYLLQLHHQTIIGIFKADDSQGIQRHKGYVRALQQFQKPYDPDHVIWFHTEDAERKPIFQLEQLLQKQNEQIDGIVCYNDQMALQVLQFLKSIGKKVPEELSVTGYDNAFFAQDQMYHLTTIAHPKEQLGQEAAKLLFQKIDGTMQGREVTKRLPVQLMIRGSCKDRSAGNTNVILE